MGIFNNSKLKVKIKNINDIINLSINYNKIKNIEEFKVSLLGKLIGNNLCLAIIDSKLQFKEVNSSFEKLKASLEELNIPYEEKKIKEDETVKVLGISMKVSGSAKARRQMLGIIISTDNLNRIMEIIKGYNTYYYFDLNKTEKNELLHKIELYFNDEEELFNNLGLSIFDGIAFQNMNINASTKYFNYVNDIINSLNK